MRIPPVRTSATLPSEQDRREIHFRTRHSKQEFRAALGLIRVGRIDAHWRWLFNMNALDAADQRAIDVRVAGPSALLVAKLHKLADRTQEAEARRLKDKDALDVLRLLRAIPVERLAQGLRDLRDSSLAGEVTRDAIALLEALFGATSSPGIVMAVRATERLEDPGIIAASALALAGDLMRAMH
jgi:hypothetical protein